MTESFATCVPDVASTREVAKGIPQWKKWDGWCSPRALYTKTDDSHLGRVEFVFAHDFDSHSAAGSSLNSFVDV